MIYNKENIIGHELEAVKKHGYNIRFIDNPSEEVQLAAVKEDGGSVQFIKNPLEEVKLEAVKEDGYAIQYIKNPTEEVQLEIERQKDKFNIRLSGIAYESLVNGSGMRRVLFAQGCTHNCKGCFNPDTHDINGGEIKNINEIVEDILQNPIIKGVTFSGGDPFEQADKFTTIAQKLKVKDLNIWCYTGYTFEELFENKDHRNGWSELLNNIDVLVDSKFDETKKGDFRYRGSSNQRIIDIKKTLETKEIKILNFD